MSGEAKTKPRIILLDHDKPIDIHGYYNQKPVGVTVSFSLNIVLYTHRFLDFRAQALCDQKTLYTNVVG